MDSSHTPNLHWVGAVFLTLHGLRWPHLHEVKATNLKHTKQVPQKAIIRKKATERQRKVFCLIFPTNQKIPAVGSLSTPQSTSLVCIAPSVSLCKLTLLPFSSGNDPLGPGPWVHCPTAGTHISCGSRPGLCCRCSQNGCTGREARGEAFSHP